MSTPLWAGSMAVLQTMKTYKNSYEQYNKDPPLIRRPPVLARLGASEDS